MDVILLTFGCLRSIRWYFAILLINDRGLFYIAKHNSYYSKSFHLHILFIKLTNKYEPTDV